MSKLGALNECPVHFRERGELLPDLDPRRGERQQLPLSGRATLGLGHEHDLDQDPPDIPIPLRQ